MQLPEDRYRFSSKKESNFSFKKLIAGMLVLAFVIGAILLFQRKSVDIPLFHAKQNESVEEVDIAGLWEKRDYARINEICEEYLNEDPLNPEYLAINGFAYFYRGTSLYTLEDQIPLYDNAIKNLRKVLVTENTTDKGKVHYVLGKTYFHKGRFFSDLSIEHLEQSLDKGYLGSDTYRYLGLGYSELGDYERGVENFLLAAEENPDPLLYMTIGQTYYKMKKTDKALDFLMRAVHSTDEEAIEKKSRFLIGSIYLELKEFQKAKDQYEKILSIDADSADAHYYLGEIYDNMGEQVKARAEWRKVLTIDPSHYGALLKLY